MEYVNILSMVMDSDPKTTAEFKSLFNDVDTNFFVDSSLISDTRITNRTNDGRFISLYRDEEYDCIVLEYLLGSTGSTKSCNKKIRIEFIDDLSSHLLGLQPDKLTSIEDDIDKSQLCMVATIYDLARDKVDFNQILETEKYYVCYYLRKNNNDEYYLESQIRFSNPQTNNNVGIDQFSTLHKIKQTFQRMLNTGK